MKRFCDFWLKFRSHLRGVFFGFKYCFSTVKETALRQAFFDQGFSDDGDENPNESLLTFPHKTLGVKCPLGNYDLRPKPSFTSPTDLFLDAVKMRSGKGQTARHGSFEIKRKYFVRNNHFDVNFNPKCLGTKYSCEFLTKTIISFSLWND